ncbi:PUB domain containing protein [Nitzschia inconspicua]|uniref:PUB domain containing protein n=1 Tax=Nitzschia inconspicua TaxID=303405 RepID=A0A9K3KXQ5_9STRA|nr:PUB domain containing protein [Nitzschia inconspicua]
MTLRLSSSTSLSSSSSSSPSVYIERIAQDTTLSLSQKTDCLKTLSVILKNLIDPTKGSSTTTENDDDSSIKYRTLKRDNPKLATRLFCVSHTYDLFLQLGFVSTSNGTVLIMEQPPSSTIQGIVQTILLPVITDKQTLLSTSVSNKKPKLLYGEEHEKEDFSKLSEKQKARRLLAQKQQEEKELAKQARAVTKAQIAADKRVRQDDENWKPSVSAAADKTGTGLLTFRDRHGE